MSKPLTIKQMARLGGKKSAEKKTPAQRSKLGKKGAKARWGNKDK